MKILAVGVQNGEAYNLPLGEGQGSVTVAIYGGEIGNLRLYGYVTLEEPYGKDKAAIGIVKPLDIEWGNIQNGTEFCRPPVEVQAEPSTKVKGRM